MQKTELSTKGRKLLLYKQQHVKTQIESTLLIIKLHHVEEWNLEAEHLINKGLANMDMAKKSEKQ